MPRHGPQSAAARVGDNEGAAVVAFRHREATTAPAVSILVNGDRPVHSSPRRHGPLWLLLLLGSLAVHAAAIVVFNAAPRQVPKVGIPAITVDIVIGDNSAAGVASTPGHESAVETKTVETVRAERTTVAVETVKPSPILETVARLEPLVSPSEAPTASTVETVGSEVHPLRTLATAEAATPAVVQPRPEKPLDPLLGPPDVTATVRRAEEVAAVEQLPVRDQPPARAAPASVASGISRGGSIADSNYHGRVAAHLARHKRFPPDARRRGEHGNAGIDFTIDGSGLVTAVRIARSSGFAALDRAAEAMVWKASPFPSPPDQRPQRFSVPVSYSLR